MISLAFITCLIIAPFIVRVIIARIRHRSIAYLPGPKAKRWLVGNFAEIFRLEPFTSTECRWTEEYGTAMCIKGVFGEDVLLLSDPKALQFILNTSGYNFRRPQWFKATASLLTGEGLSLVHGEQHARQRRIIAPAFHFNTLLDFKTIFTRAAQQMVEKWNNTIYESGSNATVIEVTKWMSRTTLDALGEAVFDYKFGALEGKDNELAKIFQNLMPGILYKRPDFLLTWEAFCGYLPFRLVKVLQAVFPAKHLKRSRSYMKVARSVARDIIETQKKAYTLGKEGSKDVMSLMIRANLSENPRTQMNDEEIMAQMTTFMLAGHETTAKTISWALYELSKHPEHQSRLRDEIRMARKEALNKGNTELTVSDLDSMKYLLAVIKETLRVYPIIPFIRREPVLETAIPLSFPVRSKTGDMVTNIPISTGQGVLISVAAYNKLKLIWGEDADIWRPERFLEDLTPQQKTSFGVISNIGTFGSGIRSCIGWRFAMIEMQTFIIEFLQNFEFTATEATKDVVAAAVTPIAPMLKSEPGRIQLPLLVSQI